MKLLLDTHTALWLVNEHEKLSLNAKALLLNEEHTLFISIASLWEIAIKASLGKLSEFSGGVEFFITQVNKMPITLLQITPRHIEIVEILPFIHRDPFDRMLISTAKAEEMTIITADENIHKYDVPAIW
jgi:PIN domain nuclease of toxin-antitoxin system